MPGHLDDRCGGCIDLETSGICAGSNDNVHHQWIHHRTTDDDESETVKSLLDPEPFMPYDASGDDSSADEKEGEDHKTVFDFLFCFRRLHTHKWDIDDRAVLGPPEYEDDENTRQDMHSTDSAVFWSSREELSEFDKSRVHKKWIESKIG